MSTCEYARYVGGPCGTSELNANVLYVTLGRCTKDITRHLSMYKIRDAILKSEFQLLLSRAGKYYCNLYFVGLESISEYESAIIVIVKYMHACQWLRFKVCQKT